jgi:hypothetical protein
MRPEVQQAIDCQATSGWELQKRLLYNGKQAAVLHPKRGMLVIGDGAEATTIAETVQEFADRVVKAMKEFSRQQVKGSIDAQVLTGGGTLIPLVRKALVKAMKANASTQVFDLLERPHQVRRWRDGTWGWYDDARDIESEARQNLELVRTATAIGGCSVFFE